MEFVATVTWTLDICLSFCKAGCSMRAGEIPPFRVWDFAGMGRDLCKMIFWRQTQCGEWVGGRLQRGGKWLEFVRTPVCFRVFLHGGAFGRVA